MATECCNCSNKFSFIGFLVMFSTQAESNYMKSYLGDVKSKLLGDQVMEILQELLVIAIFFKAVP